MADGRLLKLVAGRFVPDYSESIDWEDVWDRPLSEGTAFEWTVLAAIAAQAQASGWHYELPLLDIDGGGKLFPLWNEIPTHHGAQPGHSSATHHKQSLPDRFLQALVPKLLLDKQGVYYSVFREGCPYHKIMTGKHYDERPDILFLPGRPTPGFPRFARARAEVDFSFDMIHGPVVTGSLRVVNSPTIPCRRRYPSGGVSMQASEIVECSINKSIQMAVNQLSRYDKLFATADSRVAQTLVTGNDIRSLPAPWKMAVVDLSSEDPGAIERDLRRAANLSLATLGVA